MTESTLLESAAEHSAPDLARHTLVPSGVNYKVACPVQNKENKIKIKNCVQITCILITKDHNDLKTRSICRFVVIASPRIALKSFTQN